MTLTLERPQRATIIRPLGADYVEVLQRQTRQRNAASIWSWDSVKELIAEPPSNFAFLREHEVDNIRSFAGLPANWDLYGALAITPLAIQSTIELIQHPAFVQLLPQYLPRLLAFPMRNGGIQLDLNGGRFPIEIEIFPDGSREYTSFGPDDDVRWEVPTLALAIQLYQDTDTVNSYPE